MKLHNRLRRFGSLTLALLMLISALAACTPAGTPDGTEDTTAQDTPADTEAGTDTPTVQSPTDIPKEGNYVTTTDLVIL